MRIEELNLIPPETRQKTIAAADTAQLRLWWSDGEDAIDCGSELYVDIIGTTQEIEQELTLRGEPFEEPVDTDTMDLFGDED